MNRRIEFNVMIKIVASYVRSCQRTQLKISQKYKYMMLLELELDYIHQILYKTKDEKNKKNSKVKRLFKMRRNKHVIT